MRSGGYLKLSVFAVAVTLLAGAATVAAVSEQPAPGTDTTVASGPPPGMVGITLPDPVTMPSDPQAAAMIMRGRYLTIAGDCVSCHTVSGQPAFSGGYAVDTPVGTIFSPNLTPSKTYGLGNETDRQFWNALHNGIGRGSSWLVFPKYLYPVMPSTSYSKLTYPDVMAIKAYLQSIPAVEIKNRPMTIPFPFNFRPVLLGWQLLFLHPKPVQYADDWSPSVRNGAYIVQALAHCSECHTPRNIAMATKSGRFLAGGHIISQSWYAPNISASNQFGIGGWSGAELVQYLHGDGDTTRGAPFGPMKETVDYSLSRLPVSDIQDVVNYLRTTTPMDNSSTTPEAAAPVALGAQVYAGNCARCHGADGAGVNNNFPNLAHNEAISVGEPDDAISMLLGGFQPWHANQSAMPSFAYTLSDSQIAAVVNYIRTSWGNGGAADATADHVASLRGVTVQEVALDTGTVQALWSTASGSKTFKDISGTFEFEGNRTNCQIDATFLPTTGAAIHLGGSCNNPGEQLHGTVTMNGQASPVVFALKDFYSGPAVTGVMLDGALPDGSHLAANIAFITPND